jgi:hypothetical protein
MRSRIVQSSVEDEAMKGKKATQLSPNSTLVSLGKVWQEQRHSPQRSIANKARTSNTATRLVLKLEWNNSRRIPKTSVETRGVEPSDWVLSFRTKTLDIAAIIGRKDMTRCIRHCAQWNGSLRYEARFTALQSSATNTWQYTWLSQCLALDDENINTEQRQNLIWKSLLLQDFWACVKEDTHDAAQRQLATTHLVCIFMPSLHQGSWDSAVGTVTRLRSR